MSETTKIQWVHPDPDDDGQMAMTRIGVEIGEEFLTASVASWEMPPFASRYSGDGLWRQGKLVVHKYHRYRLAGWHTPEYGECDKGMVKTGESAGISAVNVVIGKLRTGNIAGDPELVFPIAKAPKAGGP